jgi:sugar phosphate permease
LVTGSFLAVIHFSGAGGRIVWGIVSDRLFGGRRRGVLLLVCSMAVVMSVLTAGLTSDLPYWLIYLLLGIFGFAVVGWTGMWVALISELAGRNQSGTALGFSMTFMQVGKVSGPPLIGLCHDLTHSYRPGWLILAVVLAIGTYIFYLVKENRVD